MIKHRACCLLVATMCSFLLPPLGAAAEEDQIESRLTEAQEHFAELEAELRDALVSAMMREREKAQRAGDLNRLKQIDDEMTAFSSTRQLPTCVSTGRFKSQMERAVTRMIASYEDSVRKYTQQGQIEFAEAIQEQLSEFKKSKTLVPSRPKDAVELNGAFYKIYPEVLTWAEAQKKCRRLGGMLACPSTPEENAFLVKLAASRAEIDAVWIGATDQAKEGEWIRTDNQQLSWANWGPQQPNNKNGVENYAVLITKHAKNPSLVGKWSDQPIAAVQHKAGFVCVWRK